MPKSKIPVKRGVYRNSRCSRDRHKGIYLTEGGPRLLSGKSAEVIVTVGKRAVRKGGGLTNSEGLNVE